MTKQTLRNKGKFSILKLSGFRARMKTSQGCKIINKRRRKNRYKLSLSI
jgi:ribosomal protein L34